MKARLVRQLCEHEGPSTGLPRAALTAAQRKIVLSKTAGKCHLCGGSAGLRWEADHLVSHRGGGKTSVDNCLPICPECNKLRRSYSSKVLQLVLQLGIYARSEIRRGSPLGQKLLRLYLRRQKQTYSRRRA